LRQDRGIFFVCLGAVEGSSQPGYGLIPALEFQLQPIELDFGQLNFLFLRFQGVLKAPDQVFLDDYVSSAPCEFGFFGA
jgi:hypothetical protein